VVNDSCNISTTTTSVIGTTRWMAPELFRVEDTADNPVEAQLTESSDIYAFGMVNIEVSFILPKSWPVFHIKACTRKVFTGNKPFYRIMRNEAVILQVLAGVRPERPTGAFILGLSDAVWSMVELCWHQQQSSRPQIEDILLCFEHAAKEQISVVANFNDNLSNSSDHVEDNNWEKSLSLCMLTFCRNGFYEGSSVICRLIS
jgi:serine/threonine protein kinase